MSQEMMLRGALQRFSEGDGVDDEELKEMMNFFKRLVGVLEETVNYFSPLYGFALRDARHNLEVLKCFDRARKEAKKEGK